MYRELHSCHPLLSQLQAFVERRVSQEPAQRQQKGSGIDSYTILPSFVVDAGRSSSGSRHGLMGTSTAWDVPKNIRMQNRKNKNTAFIGFRLWQELGRQQVNWKTHFRKFASVFFQRALILCASCLIYLFDTSLYWKAHFRKFVSFFFLPENTITIALKTKFSASCFIYLFV